MMKEAPISEEDRAVMQDPNHFGVIHSDMNTSNFFYVKEEDCLSVFDWD